MYIKIIDGSFKQSKILRILFCVTILLLFIQFPINRVSACQNLATYESDYITPKTTFVQGEIVYAKETYGSKETVMLRIIDPDEEVVFTSEPVHSKTITCAYPLDNDALLGQWQIQIARFYDGSWHWLTGKGDITEFSVITQRPYTLSTTVSGNGIVNVNPDESSYLKDAHVELTAIADEGWTFSHWSDDFEGNQNPTTILMDDNKSIQAHFIENTLTLTIEITGQGIVARDIDQDSYAPGTMITLTAAPKKEWTFDKWTGDLQSSTDVEIITINEDMQITAIFKEKNTGSTGGSSRGSSSKTSYSSPSTTTEDKQEESDNTAPIAKITLSDSNIYTTENPITIYGILSYDPDGIITDWVWTIDDDIHLSGNSITHQFIKPGVHTIKLTVIDDHDETNETEKQIKIKEPDNPFDNPEIIGPNKGTTEQSYPFTIRLSDSEHDHLIYTIDWGDETKDTSEQTFNNEYKIAHQFSKPGTYEITATVTNGQQSAASTSTIEIQEIEKADHSLALFIVLSGIIIFMLYVSFFQKEKIKKILHLQK